MIHGEQNVKLLPTCFGVCCTIFRETIALLSKKNYKRLKCYNVAKTYSLCLCLCLCTCI